MLWLEMSRNVSHGGGSWGFTKCLWSPSRKTDNTKWAYWETVLCTRAEDTVLHLRGEGKDAAFVGFSTVGADGVETTERPPEPGQWGYSTTFYRALLKDFVPFATSVPLAKIFRAQDAPLRDYFQRNKAQPRSAKRRLFYVIQAGRLQCLNGAYLSEIDEELSNIILSGAYSYPLQTNVQQQVIREVSTGEQIQQLRARVGQNDFSEQVRTNYGNRCCFPSCEIDERKFLVAAHIARWADAPELRGLASNGLCLCLMHDKAFEIGLFTLGFDLRVWVNKETMSNSPWGIEHLLPYHGQPIRTGNILPSQEALLYHWERTNLYPTF